MKLFKNPRLVLPLVLITLLIGATTAYVAISGSFINCASLTNGVCDGTDGQTGDSDVINGSSGDDIIKGGGGDDTIFGNDGNDNIGGDAGNDTIFGGSGDDYLCGGDGDDTLWGGPGSDGYCSGDAGTNYYIFQPGDVPAGETEEVPPEANAVCVFLGYSGTEGFDPETGEPWSSGNIVIVDPLTEGEIDIENCDEVYGVLT